jgi:mRNA-degrading endonuclease toxin of MazEF toxin-antitoxin module
VTEYYPQGSILIVPDPHSVHDSRPVIVISDIDRPKLGEEYTVIALSTQEYYANTVSVPRSAIVEGQFTPRGSRVCPWSLHPIAHEVVKKRVARVSYEFLEHIADALYGMVAPSG